MSQNLHGPHLLLVLRSVLGNHKWTALIAGVNRVQNTLNWELINEIIFKMHVTSPHLKYKH